MHLRHIKAFVSRRHGEGMGGPGSFYFYEHNG
jgi:hypothetical protein